MPKYAGRVGLTLILIYGVSHWWNQSSKDNTMGEPNPPENIQTNHPSSGQLDTQHVVSTTSTTTPNFKQPNVNNQTQQSIEHQGNKNNDNVTEITNYSTTTDQVQEMEYGARLRKALYQIYQDRRRGSEF